MLFDIESIEAQQHRRNLLRRRIEARRLGEQPGHQRRQGLVFISHLGEVYPSGFLPVSSGNVRRQLLTDIFRNSPLLRKLRDSRNLQGKCGLCEYREICGGSRARSFAMTGDMFAEEPCCVYEPKAATQQVKGRVIAFQSAQRPKVVAQLRLWIVTLSFGGNGSREKPWQ